MKSLRDIRCVSAIVVRIFGVVRVLDKTEKLPQFHEVELEGLHEVVMMK